MRSRVASIMTALTLTAVAVTGCGEEGEPDGSATSGPTPSASSSNPTSSNPTPSATPPGVSESAVYYLVDTRTGLRLASERRELSGDDPGRSAVQHMIAGPLDPDYNTTWNPATRVLSVNRDGDAIVVDLSREARQANVGSEGAERMIDQLVYTVTEALDRSAAVLLRIDGEPAGELWGAVSWTEPVHRHRPLDVRQLVQIDSPGEGATVTSPLTVTGDAAVFEAHLPWRVLDESGVVVQQGFTMTAEGQRFAAYTFNVALAPGTYVVEITEDDPSDGEGGTPMTDTRTVTVE